MCISMKTHSNKEWQQGTRKVNGRNTPVQQNRSLIIKWARWNPKTRTKTKADQHPSLIHSVIVRSRCTVQRGQEAGFTYCTCNDAKPAGTQLLSHVQLSSWTSSLSPRSDRWVRGERRNRWIKMVRWKREGGEENEEKPRTPPDWAAQESVSWCQYRRTVHQLQTHRQWHAHN